MPTWMISAAVAAVVAVIAVRVVLGYARRRLVDAINDRSSHTRPTPRGGGLGLVVGMFAGWGVGVAMGPGLTIATVVVALALAAIAAVGWIDDHGGVSARWRLLIQFLVVVALVAAVGVPTTVDLGWGGAAFPVWLVAPVLVVGGVWLVNLTNFMDGIDGIAAVQAAIGLGAQAALLSLAGADAAAVLPAATAAAAGGFLVWNRPPAAIFLGDVGSTVLGLVAAFGVVVGVGAGVPLEALLLPFLPFIADATATLGRRAWRRERLAEAHRSHLYQRLARHWGGHGPVTVVYGMLALLGAVGAWVSVHALLPPWTVTGSLLVLFMGLVVYGRRCAHD
jgi:Fuc2NAc and GlcNAc transferase